MGGVLAALSHIRNWGRLAPYVNSHCDCACSNSPSSSSSEEDARKQRKTTTWLQRHRPDPEEPRTARAPPAKHHKGAQTEGHDRKHH